MFSSPEEEDDEELAESEAAVVCFLVCLGSESPTAEMSAGLV
jgi:hypothetical protein